MYYFYYETLNPMNNMKVVIISKVIFPYLSPRSFRATELAKELARQGHHVVLYAVLGNYNYGEFKKKYTIQIKNIGTTTILDKNSDGDIKRNLIVRGIYKFLDFWLEFKSIELFFMLKKIVRKEKNTDLLITIGGPYTIHWGAALSKKINRSGFPKLWIADCGDPFMGNALVRHPFYFKYVEKWFCKKADFITIPLEAARKAYYKEFQHKIKVIPQGLSFDEILIKKVKTHNRVKTFIYAGYLYKGSRDPTLFLKYLTTIQREFLFIIYTKKTKFLEPFMDFLGERLIVQDYIPRPDLLQKMSEADFLINFENGTDVQSPSKLIDYALAGRPVLSVNCKYLNKEAFNEFLNGNYIKKLKINDISQYDIKNVASEFIKLTL